MRSCDDQSSKRSRRKKKSAKNAVLVLVPLALAACTDPDQVVFVTSSNLGLNVDGATQTANVALDRYETIVAPVYKGGGLPPAVGGLKTDGGYFVPSVDHIYATGDAALIVVDNDRRECKTDDQRPRCSGSLLPPIEMDGNNQPTKDENNQLVAAPRKRMFFGTTTSLGVNAGLSTESPASINVGYKRRELSIIPMMAASDGKNDLKDQEHYASTLASLRMRANQGCGVTEAPTENNTQTTPETDQQQADLSSPDTEGASTPSEPQVGPEVAAAPSVAVETVTASVAQVPVQATADPNADTPIPTTAPDQGEAAPAADASASAESLSQPATPEADTMEDKPTLKAEDEPIVCLTQFFATGGAARGLAKQNEIQEYFKATGGNS